MFTTRDAEDQRVKYSGEFLSSWGAIGMVGESGCQA